MTFDRMLDLVVERTGHERYRYLTSVENPDLESREGYRRSVVRRYHALTDYPRWYRQTWNAVLALGRLLAQIVRRRSIEVSAGVYRSRLAICRGCEFHELASGRCRKCGCRQVKLRLATERCPLDPPRWDRV